MFHDLKNQRFGRLVVKEKCLIDKREWICICDCGNTSTVRTYDLRAGNTKSCGCLMREIATVNSTTHGLSNSPEYGSWHAMIQRCTNPSQNKFHNYGGRGITVCDRWRQSFEAFYADMGPKPTPNHSIDRYPDMNGNYEPGNCRWATGSEQASNTRRTCVYEYDGKMYTAFQLASNHGITQTRAFQQRLIDKWDVERAINQPIIQRFRK